MFRYLSNNQLSGTIPSSIGTLVQQGLGGLYVHDFKSTRVSFFKLILSSKTAWFLCDFVQMALQQFIIGSHPKSTLPKQLSWLPTWIISHQRRIYLSSSHLLCVSLVFSTGLQSILLRWHHNHTIFHIHIDIQPFLLLLWLLFSTGHFHLLLIVLSSTSRRLFILFLCTNSILLSLQYLTLNSCS